MTPHSVINIKTLEEIKGHQKIAPAGFRYGFIEDLFSHDFYQRLVGTFPNPRTFKLISKMSGGGHKKFYLGPEYAANRTPGCGCALRGVSPEWQKVFRICNSPKFITYLSEKTGVPCNSLCNFGFTYGNEGCHQESHVDGAVRPNDPNSIKATLALLLYFNQEKSIIGGTYVCMPDRKTIIMQAPHLFNSAFYFEQHPDAWHGFPEMPTGAERHLVSLTYSLEREPVPINNSFLHQTTCKHNLKRIFHQLMRK